MHELSLTPEFVFENSSPDVIGCRGYRFGRSKFVDLSGDVSFTTVNIFISVNFALVSTHIKLIRNLRYDRSSPCS